MTDRPGRDSSAGLTDTSIASCGDRTKVGLTQRDEAQYVDGYIGVQVLELQPIVEEDLCTNRCKGSPKPRS
jgi:hypothetical protein